jgi:YNFM family putative membrane transporter
MATYGLGAIAYSLMARRLLSRLGERGLVLLGGFLISASLVGLAITPTVVAAPVLMAVMGLAFYMFHNTLQTNATQMAPEARGLAVSLFAFALFLGQALGVAVGAPIIDRWGAPPFFIATGLCLPFVAIWFRNRLAQRPVA